MASLNNDKYSPAEIEYKDPAEIKLKVGHPGSGYRAFYVELTYPDPVEGTYSITTRMFVADDDELFLN